MSLCIFHVCHFCLCFCVCVCGHLFPCVHQTVSVCVFAFLCEIPLGAVAPAGRGCPPVSWQSSGSHGNEARDAPALDLWYSPPPEELQERERARKRERQRVKQSQSLRPHLKFMYMSNLGGQRELPKLK